MDFEIRRHRPDELLATAGPVVIRILNGVVTEREDVDRGCALFEELLERYPAIACLAVVEHGTPIPSAENRRYTAERFGSYAPRVITGVALLGLGFWASAALAATKFGLRIMGRQNLLIDTSAEGIANKLALELVGLDAEELVAVIEELRGDLSH